MGSHIVVMNSGDVAIDLLERRPVIYADRVRAYTRIPHATFCSQKYIISLACLWSANCTTFPHFSICTAQIIPDFRMGCSWSFVVMHYGDAWRINRRLFHRFFNISVVDQLNDKIYKAVNAFLLRLSESPERFLKHTHLYVSPRRTKVLRVSG